MLRYLKDLANEQIIKIQRFSTSMLCYRIFIHNKISEYVDLRTKKKFFLNHIEVNLIIIDTGTN